MSYSVQNTIMDGVREDLSMLIYDFVSSNRTDFSNFVKIWKANEFCYIFSGRLIVKEVKYFTREILILAKKHSLQKNMYAERIAGVYLMYALYNIQPLKVPVRIRIEKEEFSELLNFVKESSQKEMRYCFYQLFINHAFDYVYSENSYTLERIRERDLEFKVQKPQVQVKKEQIMTPKEQIEATWNAIGFDQQSWLKSESEYNKLKSTLNMISGEPSFEMTELLKPLFTIEEKIRKKDNESDDAKSSSKTYKRYLRARSAFKLLEEESTSSEEDALGGDCSMPQIAGQLLDDDVEEY